MANDAFTLAVITDVFPDAPSWDRFKEVLQEAAGKGAELAVLPELPLNPWSPATRSPRDDDAEEVDGPRQKALSRGASEAGIAVLGGAIIRDPDSGIRHNTALLYSASGSCMARYKKIHLPAEEGYWETSHYRPGTEPPTVVSGLPMKLGFQVCSDVNRTTGFQLLGAMGAELVLVPRCTPPETYERWKLVLRANAVTSGCFVVSPNRPAPTPEGFIGGPSIAISPTSEVLLETNEPLALVTLDRDVLQAARDDYPGYLDVFPDVYARGWESVDPEGEPES